MTFQEVITFARMLADTGENAFDNTSAILALNAALQDFADKGGYPNGTYTQSVTSGTSKYDLNSTSDSWTEALAAWYDEEPLISTSERELDGISPTWMSQTGRPTHYMMVDGNTKIQLWPEPSADLTNGLITRFTKKATAATAATLTASPEIPSQYHESLCWKVASIACHKFGEDEKAAYYEKKFDEKLAQAYRSAQYIDKGRRFQRVGVEVARPGVLRVGEHTVRIY